MEVYVVIHGHEDTGPTVVGVYQDRYAADKLIAYTIREIENDPWDPPKAWFGDPHIDPPVVVRWTRGGSYLEIQRVAYESKVRVGSLPSDERKGGGA